MNIVLSYIIVMFLILLTIFPSVIFFRYILNKSKKINWYHEIGISFIAVFTLSLLVLVFTPSNNNNTNLIPFKVIIETYNEVFINNNTTYFIINFLGNIIIFIPIGFFIPLLWNLNYKKIIFIGFMCSLLIEFSQIFISRGTDVDDLFLNTLGTSIGLYLYVTVNKKWSRITSKFKLE